MKLKLTKQISNNSQSSVIDLAGEPVYAGIDVHKLKWKVTIRTGAWRCRHSACVEFPQETRKVIYTTNAVEALHRQFRKVTKSKTVFPNDDALLKMLYLAHRNMSKKRTMILRDWKTIISQLCIIFGERFEKYL